MLRYNNFVSFTKWFTIFMRSFQFLFLGFLTLAFFVGTDVYAQSTDDLCARAESTADTMACTKKRHDDAQENLQYTYQKALDSYIKAENTEGTDSKPKESGVSLKESQTDWLAYRDQECERQVAQEETESLKQLKKLSCYAALTEQRTDTLLSEMEEREKRIKPAAFESLPIWMNVLAKNHKEIFWNYGNRLSADLNCDEEKEHIIGGVRFRNNGTTPNIDAVIAISDNPLSGRPSASLFYFPVSSENTDNGVCSENLKLGILPTPPRDKESDVKSCDVVLNIEDDTCAIYSIIHENGAYSLQNLE